MIIEPKHLFIPDAYVFILYMFNVLILVGQHIVVTILLINLTNLNCLLRLLRQSVSLLYAYHIIYFHSPRILALTISYKFLFHINDCCSESDDFGEFF